MKILHITPHYHPAVGGSETYAKETSQRLARRGHDVTVLTMNSADEPESNGRRLPVTEVIDGVNVHRFSPSGRFRDLLNMFLDIRGARPLLGRAVRLDPIDMWASSPYGLSAFHVSVRSKPDVVAVINWYGGWLAYQACVARRIRNFALIGVPLFHTDCSWAQAEIYGEMLERCSAVVAMTEHERKFISERSIQQNTYAVGVGVDPEVFADADGSRVRARYGLGDAPLVGYVGRMAPLKGVPTLIQAMQRVWQTLPDARLLLAGGDLSAKSYPRNEVTQALSELSIGDRFRIIVTGPFADSEKASIFAALDVFAMPSAAESFGIAYLEAWMCRKPVIGCLVGSTQCVIDDGLDGVLVPPDNPDMLAGSIVRMLADRPTCEQMGRTGHAKTLSRFTWDRITDKLERIYNEAHLAAPTQRVRGQASKQLIGVKSGLRGG